jgi:hypothetical protein
VIANCVNKEISINNKTYNQFDNVYYPRKGKAQYLVKDENTNPTFWSKFKPEEHPNSLYRVSEIYSLIDRFNNEQGDNNYILFNYGFSGTGKTNVARGVIRNLKGLSGPGVQLESIEATHGFLGKFKSGSSVEFKSIPSSRKVQYTFKSESFDSINAFNAFKEFSHYSGLAVNSVDINIPFASYKETMNNKNSSRFHVYYKYTLKNTQGTNTLYFFDLAGSEKSSDIFKHAFASNDKSITDDVVIDELLKNPTNYFGLLRGDKTKNTLTSLSKEINNKTNTFIFEKAQTQKQYTKVFKYIFGLAPGTTVESKDINDMQKETTMQTIRERTQILLESFYIHHSLNKLKESLLNYSQTTQNRTLQAIPEVGIKENLENVQKICMFGFIRNDKLDGAQHTLDLLSELIKPPVLNVQRAGSRFSRPKLTNLDKHLYNVSSTYSQKGGGTGSSRNDRSDIPITHSQVVNNMLTAKAEHVLESIVVKGGGLLHNTVLDIDRALFIGISFVFLVITYQIKMILDRKESKLEGKRVATQHSSDRETYLSYIKDVSRSPAFLFIVQVLSYAVLVNLGSVNMSYIMLYVLLFCILYLSMKLFQIDPETKRIMKRLKLKSTNDSETQERTQNDLEDLIITWVLMSMYVIFV